MDPPAEVDVLAEQGHRRVEPADLIPHIAADQHPGAAHRQNVPVPVVLALVHFARLDAGDTSPGAVDGDASLKEHPPVGPAQHLGTEHGRATRLGRAEQQLLQGVRRGLAVVVQQPDPLDPVALRQPGRPGNVRVGGPVPQRLADRGAVAGGAVHAEHDRPAEEPGQHSAAPVPATRVHCDDPLNRPGLAEQRLRHAWQPRGTVVSDNHRGYDMLALRVIWRHESVCCSRW